MWVHLTEGVRIALASLRANPLRTLLTLLGNVVGMMSVIAVVSVLAGVDRFVRTEIAEEGSNTVVLRQFDLFTFFNDFEAYAEAMHNPEITLADVEYLRDAALPGARFVGTRATTETSVTRRTRTVEGVTVHGRSWAYPFIDNAPIARGRHITETEDRAGRPVAVLGSELAERLFDGTNPLGQTIHLGGRHVEVIGVLAHRPSTLGNDPNDQAIIPIRMFLKMFGGRSLEVPILAVSVDALGPLTDEVRLAMRIRRGLKPSDRETFAVSTAANLVSLWQRISALIFGALVGVVGISLVVGGIVVMNIMLVSVTERTREIGLRKALGARRRDVTWQFLVEAITLSGVGGAIGIALGFLIALALATWSPLPYAVEAWSIGAGLAVTLGVGVVFGIYPAIKAARLDPTEALRHE